MFVHFNILMHIYYSNLETDNEKYLCLIIFPIFVK